MTIGVTVIIVTGLPGTTSHRESRQQGKQSERKTQLTWAARATGRRLKQLLTLLPAGSESDCGLCSILGFWILPLRLLLCLGF